MNLESGALPQRAAGRFSVDRRSLVRLKRQLPNYLFLVPFAVGFIWFHVYPIIFGLRMSLYNWDIVDTNPEFVGLANYHELMGDWLWWLTLRQTLQYAVQTVFLTVILSLIAALICTANFPGRGFFRVLYYYPVTLSVAVVALIWQGILDTNFGLLNYFLSFLGIPKLRWLQDSNLMLPSLTMASLWGSFGYPMVILMAGLGDIPAHLYDAAMVDGANGWQRFWRITLPLLRPTMLFVLVTQFIGRLSEFGLPYSMVGIAYQYRGGAAYAHWTVIVYLYQVAWHWYRMGYGSAIAIALSVVIFLVTVIQFRLLGQRLQY